jgi:hypothetical protein
MAVLTSAGITFGDSTSQTTAATAAALVTTANVLSATAGASAGAVGTYAFLKDTNATAGRSFGSTYASTFLSPSDAGGGNVGSVSGTWRCMGYANQSGDPGGSSTLWLRIS